MRWLKSFASLSGLAIAITAFSGSANASDQQRFEKYISAWKHPNAIFNNSLALDTRLQLLDVAPQGSTVKIAALNFDNGESTRLLAAHICRASQRGVKVQMLIDSKSGSIPGEPNLFDFPITEEVYQYVANCGAQVRIYNHLPSFTVKLGKVLPHPKYLLQFAKGLKDAHDDKERQQAMVNAQVPINRLNHRKLFWVQSPSGRACSIIGGRNLGDHYLAWHEDSFIDGDIVYCDHHQKNMKNASANDQSNRVIADASASFDHLWNDTDSSAGVKVEHFDIQPNLNFPFKLITLEKESTHDGKKTTRDQKELQLVRRATDATSPAEGVIPAARAVPTTDGIIGRQYDLAYNWRVRTAVWDPKRDQVRQETYDMIRREQAEIFLESAYMEYDVEMQKLLLEALDRGVDVTVISNSMYVSDGPSKLISLARAEWTNKAMSKYGKGTTGDFKNFAGMPRHLYADKTGPGKFQFFVTTAYAGHMIHFKGAGFKCQKNDDGTYKKSFMLGSHNLHIRSGLADKEHAIFWDEPVDLTCVTKIGREKFSAAQIAEIESQYRRSVVPGKGEVPSVVQAKYRDMIEDRLRFYSAANIFYLRANKPILYSFGTLYEELQQELPSKDGKWSLNSMLGKGYKFVARRLIFQEEPVPGLEPKISATGEKVFQFLSPLRDFMADFL